MPKPLPPEFARLFHAYHMALDTDRLPLWQMIAIGAATVGFGLFLESGYFKQKRQLMVGFRAGVMMGLLASSMSVGLLAFVSYRSLLCGAIKCMGRHCHGYDFTDLLDHRHLSSDNFLSMTFQPLSFWLSYAELSLFTAVALFVLFGCIRSAAHWRELD
ncbi:hypothetical protein EAH75_10610 [Rhodanobacter glycinis]|uniref:Uncharacterized protein n=1 Tax=Rhodanobacter glycinis TaxID=582702 RepID=A0A502CE38_9GAMM|nr:hypothetical protein [Rhodanobacter glycinis]TPG11955.1 hypothetical protein EAH88_04925 [Rhodanobacter glycinis]TPG47903.1 hypothetical protein EAH75_10610 [Rhodanobacter glycinis]